MVWSPQLEVVLPAASLNLHINYFLLINFFFFF